MTQRISINVTDEVKNELDVRSEREGISATQRVVKALRLLNWWEDQPEGTKHLVERPHLDPVEVELL